MILESEYCAICKQTISKGIYGFGGTKFYKFEDGVYCEPCAKIKVNNARKSIK